MTSRLVNEASTISTLSQAIAPGLLAKRGEERETRVMYYRGLKLARMLQLLRCKNMLSRAYKVCPFL